MATKKPQKELVAWMNERTKLLADLSVEVRKISELDQHDQTQWTLNLLEELSNIEAISRRAVHLLTAYALREQLASPTVVSKKTGVTITAAQNRAGSKLAQEAWNEVWPGRRSGKA